jgi:hypothetical protein
MYRTFAVHAVAEPGFARDVGYQERSVEPTDRTQTLLRRLNGLFAVQHLSSRNHVRYDFRAHLITGQTISVELLKMSERAPSAQAWPPAEESHLILLSCRAT